MEGVPVPSVAEATGEGKVSTPPPTKAPQVKPTVVVGFTLSISEAPSGWECSEEDAARLRTLLLSKALPSFQLQARLIADQQLRLHVLMRCATFLDKGSMKIRLESLLAESSGATGVARALLRSSTCTAYLLRKVTTGDENGLTMAMMEASNVEPLPRHHHQQNQQPTTMPGRVSQSWPAPPPEHRTRPPKRERLHLPDPPIGTTGTVLDLICCALWLCLAVSQCVECLCTSSERLEES